MLRFVLGFGELHESMAAARSLSQVTAHLGLGIFARRLVDAVDSEAWHLGR